MRVWLQQASSGEGWYGAALIGDLSQRSGSHSHVTHCAQTIASPEKKQLQLPNTMQQTMKEKNNASFR
jgi:hypothetical protein